MVPGPPSAVPVRRSAVAGPLCPLVPWLHAVAVRQGPAAAYRAALQVQALAVLFDDVPTGRYALLAAVRACTDLGERAAAVRHATELLDGLPAEAAGLEGEAAPAEDLLWYAIGSGLLASARIDVGEVSGGVAALAQALAVVEERSVPSLLDAIACDVAAGALTRLLLLEHAVVVVEVGLRATRSLSTTHLVREHLTAALQRRLAHAHTLWAGRLDLLGRTREADRHRVHAASAALHLQRLSRRSVGGRVGRDAVALEAFVVQPLGAALGDLAAARVRGIPPGRPAAHPGVEVELGRLALARSLARSPAESPAESPADEHHGGGNRQSRLDRARALAEQAQTACSTTARSAWTQVCELVRAEIESAQEPREHPAVAHWRAIAASGLDRVWTDRQARSADLRQRMQHRQLAAHRARTARELLVDPLTGVGNRRLLDVALRGDRPGGAVFIDLDDFKLINDRWGHVTGDAVLRRLAGVLRGCCRSGDVILRYGGDEFLVLTREGSQAGALGERVLRRVRAQDWSDLVGDLPVRVSVGTAEASGLRDALHRSDAAAMTAKRRGRDLVVRS